MPKKRILLVDDSDTILVYEKLLLGNAFELITAKNGRLALQSALQEKPDLILMDIMMPEMDGIEALRAMRAQEVIKRTPIIMVTTKSEKSRVEICYQFGCSDFINKPIDKMELLTKVNKYLG
ncbi:MAG TPA: response regulator [Nitrospiria bacterium]|nr:response regulator [Nitrospiria bacterium]